MLSVLDHSFMFNATHLNSFSTLKTQFFGSDLKVKALELSWCSHSLAPGRKTHWLTN